MPINPAVPVDLPALIIQGEGETLEFKRSVAELEQVVETVVALANTRGGLVLIGIGPDGRVVGVDVGQVTGERVANRITGNTTGIRRMRQLMRAHGLPEPVFQEIGQTFRVTFLGPGDNILDLIPEAGVTDLRALGLNERQVQALALMVNEGKEFNNQTFRELFGVTDRTALRDLTALVATKYVRRVGEGRKILYVAT